MICKKITIALLLIAIITALPASAEQMQIPDGNIKNSYPMFMDVPYENDGFIFTGTGVYSLDDFILKSGECRVDVMATTGDWNSVDDIEAIEFEVKKGNITVMARNEFDFQTNIARPFVFAREQVTITEAGNYRVIIYVSDEQKTIKKTTTFKIVDTPEYETDGFNVNNMVANEVNEKSITVKNNWGYDQAYIERVETYNLTVTYSNSDLDFTIPTERITVTPIPSEAFGQGEEITLTVMIDLTGMDVPDNFGTVSGEAWNIVISEFVQPV
jgi:hypothetical protein